MRGIHKKQKLQQIDIGDKELAKLVNAIIKTLKAAYIAVTSQREPPSQVSTKRTIETSHENSILQHHSTAVLTCYRVPNNIYLRFQSIKSHLRYPTRVRIAEVAKCFPTASDRCKSCKSNIGRTYARYINVYWTLDPTSHFSFFTGRKSAFGIIAGELFL